MCRASSNIGRQHQKKKTLSYRKKQHMALITKRAAIVNRRTGKRWEQRFWQQVRKEENGCWTWTGCLHNCGYGLTCRDGKRCYAHRESWRMAHGTEPCQGRLVCHHCDNPSCVNPAHLYLGDNRSNMNDLVRRHGHPLHNHPEAVIRGKSHPRKLHPELWPCGAAHWTRRHPEWVARGEYHGAAKLTDVQRRTIRASEHKTERLAAIYGVSSGTIWRVRRSSRKEQS